MNGEWYVQWSIFYVRDECNCSTTQGWDYHQLWNLFSLSKILQGKRTKKTLDLIGWFFNGGSNPLGPLFGSRKTHGYPALLMDDILHRQRLDGKVSRMEHYIQVNVQNCIVEMMWTKIRNLQTRTPPGCLVTPLSICFGILKEGTGIHIYIYISIVYYMLISMQIRFGKCLDKFLFNMSRASHVIKLHWNHPNIFRFPSVPEDHSWWVNGKHL